MYKKLLIVAALVSSLSLAYAKDIKDTWFETLYEATAKNLPKGCQLRKDAETRIIFIDVPLPVKSNTQFDTAAAKAAIVKELKNTPDADFIKKAEIILIYNYITTDVKVYSVVITAKDL